MLRLHPAVNDNVVSNANNALETFKELIYASLEYVLRHPEAEGHAENTVPSEW